MGTVAGGDPGVLESAGSAPVPGGADEATGDGSEPNQ
jgi:hypothetical protein